MNERDIRKILIEYLKAHHQKLRIFNEKCIGTSICDVMAVTDKLVGFEIKSDLDNYDRLARQERAYNDFFDECWLVVGERHKRSALQKAPDGWGVLVVYSDKVEALSNCDRRYGIWSSVRSQLSLLWKLELKNILVKNGLPAYAQKSKDYIIDRLVSSGINNQLLRRQIVEELHARDYSVYEGATDYTIKQDEAESVIPQSDIVDTLSELNLSDFTLDKWIALYAKATAIQKKKQMAFAEPVAHTTEHAIKYTDISVSLGAPWVNEFIVNEFMYALFELQGKYTQVQHEAVTGAWSIQGKKSHDNNLNVNSIYGSRQYNGLQILEAILNKRSIRIYDGNVFNEKETVTALEKKKLIEEKFKEWVWQDEDRIFEIEEAYNRIFNGCESKVYNGSELTFPDMAEGFSLYNYQKDAVEKILHTPNTLLAFDVGAGKTYIMIAAAMKMRQMGMSRKNMFVVPNNIVGQWEKIFSELYPKAKLLTVEPKYFKGEERMKVLRQMRDGDYDGIIIAYSCFEMIPLSQKYLIGQIQNQLANLQNYAESLTPCGYARCTIAKREDKLKDELKKLVDIMSLTSHEITFDDLEVNSLFLDEAHNYKNIPIATKLKNIRGINATGSKKCVDMLQKVRAVQEMNGGRGVIFATGTPLCNSITDAYAMQIYLQYDKMCQTHLDVFDNWVASFAIPEDIFEIDVDTKQYRTVTRLSTFVNLPELSKLFGDIACFHAVDGEKYLPQSVIRNNVTIPKNAPLAVYMKELAERTEVIRCGGIAKEKDNMLKVSGDGRKAALDLRLVKSEQPEETARIKHCVGKVMKIYNTYPTSAQLIFCDLSTPKDSFNVYGEIKDMLIAKGVKKEEIAFIHNYQNEEKKVQLFQDVNDAKVRILLGSTFKLGIGANVQQRLKAIHHLDVPWRPADMVQREGRILRRGNQNDEVFIFRYIAEGSFDSYSWQVLETKQRFISQFLSGSAYQRSVSDLEDNVLSYGEVKAIALNEPAMKELAEKQNELKNYRILHLKETEEHDRLLREKKEKQQEIITLTKRAKRTRENSAFIKENLSAIKLILAEKQNDLTSEQISQEGKILFELSLFEVRAERGQKTEKPMLCISRNGEDYLIEAGESSSGNARRIINLLQRFDTIAAESDETVKADKAYLESLEIRLKEPFVYDKYISQCEREVEELMNKIKG